MKLLNWFPFHMVVLYNIELGVRRDVDNNNNNISNIVSIET